EDGIRDRTVTGVQTCALPIFVTGQKRKRIPNQATLFTTNLRRSFPQASAWFAISIQAQTWLPATLAIRGGTTRWMATRCIPKSKIGRASCRERVYNAEVCVVV